MEKNPQQAKALIAGLSPAQRKLFASDLQQIEADRLQKRPKNCNSKQKRYSKKPKPYQDKISWHKPRANWRGHRKSAQMIFGSLTA
ncbi:hypothetical protein PCI56_17570 [Plesiomonas shigelloides subsp. oncorhynchi]|nr:hypothetical protein [Plesiomonas shigelloides]